MQNFEKVVLVCYWLKMLGITKFVCIIMNSHQIFMSISKSFVIIDNIVFFVAVFKSFVICRQLLFCSDAFAEVSLQKNFKEIHGKDFWQIQVLLITLRS